MFGVDEKAEYPFLVCHCSRTVSAVRKHKLIGGVAVFVAVDLGIDDDNFSHDAAALVLARIKAQEKEKKSRSREGR